MKFRNVIKLISIVIVIVLLINIKNIFMIIYPIKYEKHIIKYSQKYNLSPCLVAALIKVESNFNEKAISPRDAKGLMQIVPDTAMWIAQSMKLVDFNMEALYDTEVNIAMGCWYLDNLNTEFHGDINLVLAAYNGGRGNVQKWLKDKKYSIDGKSLNLIPFEETDKYVKKVNTNKNIYLKLYGKELNASK